jgi:hypothetical protein
MKASTCLTKPFPNPIICDYCGDKFDYSTSGTTFVRYMQQSPYRTSERFFHTHCMTSYEETSDVICCRGLFPPIVTRKKH